MYRPEKLIAFVLDDQRYALYLQAVERVIRAVAITSLPEVPENILGLINIHGRIVPVYNARKRFALPEKNSTVNDRIILAHTKSRSVALVADKVLGVIEPAEGQQTQFDEITPGMELFAGVIKLDDGMLLIHDLDRFLSPVEEKSLSQAIDKTKEFQHG